jgi:hypothetical protein
MKIKNIITKCFIFLFVIASSFIFINLNIKAEDTVKTDDNNYYYTTKSEVTRELASGVEYTLNLGKTGHTASNFEERVSIFSADISKNSDVKIATWAPQNGSHTGYTRKALLDIAKDYEANNPGWIVLAGINADQYFPSFGTGIGKDGSYMYVPSPYYPMITNGDNLFTYTALGNASKNNVVGFKNDGSKTPLVNGERTIDGFYITVYGDSGEVIKCMKIDGLNCDLGSQGTVVLASYNVDKNTQARITRTGNKYYVVNNAEMSYVSNTTEWLSWNNRAVDAFFGKGVIDEVRDNVDITGGNKFAIETNNEELKAVLKKDVRIKVEVEYADEFKDIEEAMGYHTIQRRGGLDQNVDNAYNSRCYPRSMFGCDANGKVYLMTCFGDNAGPTKGLYAQEFNAVCKKYGITDAWQMDGGGSVTSIVRDENGILDYAEACIEASHSGERKFSGYRLVLSALFIVMKVPNASISVKEKKATSVSLLCDLTEIVNDYDEAKIKFFDVTGENVLNYDLDLKTNASDVVIEGLKSNTNYTYELYVKKNGYDEQRSFVNGEVNTLKTSPELKNVRIEYNEEGFIIEAEVIDTEKAMIQLYAWFGNKKYSFKAKNGIYQVSIDNDKGYNPLDLSISADCMLDAKLTKHDDCELKLNNVNYPVIAFLAYPEKAIQDFLKNLYN